MKHEFCNELSPFIFHLFNNFFINQFNWDYSLNKNMVPKTPAMSIKTVHKETGKRQGYPILFIFKRIFPVMALMPIVHRTQINLTKSEFQAGKNLKKVLASGEGRAQRNLQKLLHRRQKNRLGNPEKTGMRGFFI